MSPRSLAPAAVVPWPPDAPPPESWCLRSLCTIPISFIHGLLAAWAPMPPLCHIALARFVHFCGSHQWGPLHQHCNNSFSPHNDGSPDDELFTRETTRGGARCPARPRRLPRPPLKHLHHLIYLTCLSWPLSLSSTKLLLLHPLPTSSFIILFHLIFSSSTSQCFQQFFPSQSCFHLYFLLTIYTRTISFILLSQFTNDVFY